MNVYPVSSPTISIPRTRIKAIVRPYDNGAATEYTIPTATNLVRPGFITASCASGTSNIFTQGGVASDGSLKMNRRYTLIDQISITQNSSTPQTINVSVNFKPDSRDQFFGEAVFAGSSASGSDSDKNLINRITITGHVNYDSGEITLQGTIRTDASAAYTYTFSGARVKAKFVPVSSMKGRTTVFFAAL